MNRAARIGIVVVSVVIFCYAGLGHVLGRATDDKAYKSLTVYGEVLQKIQQDYVDDPTCIRLLRVPSTACSNRLTPNPATSPRGNTTNTKRNCRIPVAAKPA